MGEEGGIVAKLTKQEIDRHKADYRRGRKPTRHQLKAQAAAAEKSRLWVLARLNLPGGGDAKDVL